MTFNFFLNQKRKRALDKYLQDGFKDRASSTGPIVTFEASIHYYHHKIARDNLYSLLPCSKLIWILRNPLPRAVSEYLHQAVKSKSYPSFEELLRAELSAIRKCRKIRDVQLEEGFENNLFTCLAKTKLKKYMISTAFYGYFINAWIQKFPLERHIFIDYEEFRLSPKKTVESISVFLGLEPPPNLNFTWKYNKANTRDGVAKKKRSAIKLSPSVRSVFLSEVQPFIDKVYEVIHQNYDWVLDSLV